MKKYGEIKQNASYDPYLEHRGVGRDARVELITTL